MTSDSAAPDTWASTEAELVALSGEMSDIHDQFPGKDNIDRRETLLKPIRAKCRAVGERRYALVGKQELSHGV